MINVYVKSGEAINLGREGTKGVRRVIFDFTRWAREYGEGSVQLIVMRHGDTSPYPVALIIDGEEAVWEVGAADTAIPGEGECEWQYFVGEALEKSETFKTFVENAMGDAADEAPEAAQGWVEQVLEAATKAENAIKKAPIIFADTWWTWDAEAEEYVDTGVSAKGESVTIENVTESAESGGENIVTFSDGKTLTVKNGKDGKDGADGAKGAPGKDGAAGKSITEARQTTTSTADGGTNTVSFYDSTGAKVGSANIKNGSKGSDGAPGKDGAPGADGKDGKTPVKGEDYFTAEDKAELVEQVIEEMPEPSGGIEITNTAAVGQTVKITAIDADGKPTEWEAVDFPAAIVDVVELPTEDIDEDVFYRVVTATWVFNTNELTEWACHVVDGLPETGEPATTDMVNITAYYNTLDGVPYGYINEALSAQTGFPVGWYTVEMLLAATGGSYGGKIYYIDDSGGKEDVFLLLEYVVWQFKEMWGPFKSVGKSGTGRGAVMLTGKAGDASGINAVTIGFSPYADGDGSLAMGEAYALGYSSIANGSSDTSADGAYSVAIGPSAVTKSSYAVAIGNNVIARSRQIVFGALNIEDTEGKYYLIVGNGTGTRSNAHTLAWDGVGWYAGGLKVGGTGQDDENAKPVLLEGDVYSKPEIDAIMGSYINDIAAIVGGDA